MLAAIPWAASRTTSAIRVSRVLGRFASGVTIVTDSPVTGIEVSGEGARAVGSWPRALRLALAEDRREERLTRLAARIESATGRMVRTVAADLNNKADLKRIYVASKTLGDGHTYLALAWVRIPQNTTSPSAHSSSASGASAAFITLRQRC